MNVEIDVVYTWVNDKDPNWQALYRAAMHRREIATGEHDSAVNAGRFISRNELFYSLASIRKHAPWVRHIHVLTNCALPSWTNSMDNVSGVSHESVFPDMRDLPTFNSHAIETVLHRIPDLSENFIYLNDDVFLCNDIRPDCFFSMNSVHYFPSRHDIPYEREFALLRPVDTGAINSAQLLEKAFNQQPRKKLQHAPFALKKSILEEIEARFPHEVAATRSHAFRHPGDIAMATTLHAYYAAYTGRGKPREIAARYVDIGDWRFLGLVHPWSPLMRGKYATLCLNEVTDIRHFHKLRDHIVERVMKRLFA